MRFLFIYLRYLLACDSSVMLFANIVRISEAMKYCREEIYSVESCISVWAIIVLAFKHVVQLAVGDGECGYGAHGRELPSYC